LAILQTLMSQFPTVPDYQRTLARTHVNLATLNCERGKLVEARTEEEQARDLLQKLAAQFPAVPDYQFDLAAARNNLGGVLNALGKWDEARTEYEQSQEIRQKLAAQFPAVPSYQIELGGSSCNFGMLLVDQGKSAESLPWFDKAIGALTAVHEKKPSDATAKLYLRNSYWNRAKALDRLHRYDESKKDWQEATDLSPRPPEPGFRAERAVSLARAGQVAEAVADMDELTRTGEWNSDQWYTFACFYAVASGKDIDKKQAYGDRAMELLRKAVQAGWKNGAHTAQDTDLDPLRQRDDFKKLLAELPADR
jgi:tetratricopeptide (TPR) repeat protein